MDFLEDSQCLRFDIVRWNQLHQTERLVANFHYKAMEEYALYLEKRAHMLAHRAGIDRYLYILRP